MCKHETKREKFADSTLSCHLSGSPLESVEGARQKRSQGHGEFAKEDPQRSPRSWQVLAVQSIGRPGKRHTRMLLPRQGTEDGRMHGWGRGPDTDKASPFPGGSFGAHPRYASLVIGGREPGIRREGCRCEQHHGDAALVSSPLFCVRVLSAGHSAKKEGECCWRTRKPKLKNKKRKEDFEERSKIKLKI